MEYSKELFTITTELDGKNYSGVFKRPSFTTLSVVLPMLSEDKVFDADINFAKLCFESGDAEMVDFENNIEVFLSYREKLGGLLKVAQLNKFVKEAGVTIVSVTDMEENKTYTAKFGKPSFDALRNAMSAVDKGKVFSGMFNFASKSFIEGDKEMVSTAYPHLYMAYYQNLMRVYEFGISTLKKN